MVEDGLFLLDAHLRAGKGGLIDLLGVDKAGALTLLEIERSGEDELFRRALQHLEWVVAQTPFLRRLYGAERIHPFRRARVILLCRDFSESFLGKIAGHAESMTAIHFTISSNGETPELERFAGAQAGGAGAAQAEEAVPPTPAVKTPMTSSSATRGREALGLRLPAEESETGPPERLTAEELEAFYHFERRRLEQEEEGAAR